MVVALAIFAHIKNATPFFDMLIRNDNVIFVAFAIFASFKHVTLFFDVLITV
jgi:hypothetical protein